MNKFLKRLLGKLFLFSAKLLKVCCIIQPKVLPKVVNEKLLEAYGYTLKPLWGEYPKLSLATKDVSIIIPCYNAERDLKRLLDSALNQQTTCKYEVIAIDDGSSDGTLALLKDYASHYSNLLVCHQENGGAAKARNKGIEMMTGEYVGFADSDDYLSQDFIEMLYTKARKYNADMVQCGYSATTPFGTQKVYATPEKVMSIQDEEERSRLVSGFVWHSLYHRSCFEKVRFPEHFYYEDMINRMVFMRILSKIVTINDVLYYKCYKEDSAYVHQTRRCFDAQKIDQLWLAKKFLVFTQELGFPVNNAQYRQLLREWGGLLWLRTRGLGRRCQRDLFNLAASYIGELNYECTKLTDIEKTIDDALKSRNYYVWMLTSIASKLL